MSKPRPQAKRQVQQPQLSFNSNGTLFAVKKPLLLAKLGYFQEDGSRLNESEYEVKTRVPRDIFACFVKILEGEQVEVDERNVRFLRLLSEELGFEELLQECESFEDSHGGRCDVSLFSQHSVLVGRLCELE
jgi:hypothetical protein